LIPPDFVIAEEHLRATRIAKPIYTEGKPNIEESSGLPKDNQLLHLCCELDELNFLSPGYPMYF